MGTDLREYGWDKVEAKETGDLQAFPAGGYVCEIVDARTETIEGKGWQLILDVDVIAGDFAGYFHQRLSPSKGWDFNAQFKRYICREDRVITPAFKGFVKTLEKQNPNFHFNVANFDAADFKGLTCGFIFGEKEYRTRYGDVKTAVRIKFPELADKIRAGNFKIPPVEKLPPEEVDVSDWDGTPVNREDMPF